MRIVVAHDDLGADARPDERDVLDQVDAVGAALAEGGHEVSVVPLSHDRESAARVVRARHPDAVFNLVESVGGDGRRIDEAPKLFEALGLPYTGSGPRPMHLTASKLLAKQVLHAHGLPTPAFYTLEDLSALTRCSGALDNRRHILKSVWEHGSLGLAEDCVLTATDPAALLSRLRDRLDRFGGSGFAEAYVHGREFNVALLAAPRADDPGAVEHLPAAEIAFADDPREATGDAVHIVGYEAKWSPDSAADLGTPRRFAGAPEDEGLITELRSLAEAAWRAFGLRGYARIDFRIDGSGNPWIIDVNTNPCLSPDAGFAAALHRKGLPYAQAVQRILDACLRAPR